MRGFWILILAVLVVAAVSLAAAIDAAYMTGLWLLPPLILVIVAALPIAALILRDYRAAQEKSRAASRGKRKSARSQGTPSEPPTPFRQRLAKYLHVSENEVLSPRPRPASSMPFWSSVPLSPGRIVMKSVEFMRAVLERIHAAVRG